MKKKFASLLLASLGGLVVVNDPKGGLLGGTGVCILFGLLCVWGADFLGEFTGPVMRGGYVDSPTPAPLFVAFGWLLLCVPLAVYAFFYWTSV